MAFTSWRGVRGPNSFVILSTTHGGVDDRSHARRPHPRGGRAHVRPGGLGAPRRLGRRGHQDRARRAGRRHAGPRLQRARHHGHATSTCCSSTPTAASRASALDLTSDEGLDILYKLAATCDVFLTNKLPSVRSKLHIDVDDIRAHNPNIIYVRGTGQGERGPDADQGSYDLLAYWCRAGIAMGMKQPDDDYVPAPPAPAFGDSIGAMTIAGGIMGALFHRERTGEATTVDVSLLGTGLWSMGAALALSLQHEVGLGAAAAQRRPPATRSSPRTPPRTASSSPLTCLQAGEVLARGLPGHRAARARRRRALRRRRRDHGERRRCDRAPAARRSPSARRRVARARWPTSAGSGRWCRTRSRPRPTRRPLANGYVQECETAEGMPFKLAAAPVQFDEQAAAARAGARVQRARRRHPRGPRPRLGHDRGPQGPRRRGLSTREPPDTTHLSHTEQRHGHVRRIQVRRQAGAGRRRRHRHGRRRRRAGARTPAPRSSSWTAPRSPCPASKAIQRRPRRQGARSTPPSTSAAARSTPCSRAPASPTAPPASSASTSSATGT